MFCDSHCHLFREYYSNIDDVLANCKNNFVNRVFVAGCDNESNKEVVELVKRDEVYGCLGIHPEYAKSYTLDDIEFIIDNINNDKIIAIGEIGLDYHYGDDDKNEQIKLFRKQLDIAEKNNIPVVIHSRDAEEDTINILKEYNVIGVIHSFSGSIETAKKYIDMGFLLGVNGIITFKNSDIKEVIKSVGLNNIILETDSPYLAPVPNRGKQNEPSNIIHIAKFVCDLYVVDLEELAKITNSNIKRIFDI